LTLVKAIRNISEFVFYESIPDSNSKKAKRIKLPDFLKKIVKFIQNGIEKYNKQSSKPADNLNVVCDCLVLFIDLIGSSSQKEKEEMQNFVFRLD
jgi:hypothetical protein